MVQIGSSTPLEITGERARRKYRWKGHCRVVQSLSRVTEGNLS